MDNAVPIISRYRFADAEYGTIVYDQHGKYQGTYETHAAAVEHIRDRTQEKEIGGTEDGI